MGSILIILLCCAAIVGPVDAAPFAVDTVPPVPWDYAVMRKDVINQFYRLMPWIAKPTSDVRVLAWKKTVVTTMHRKTEENNSDTIYVALVWCKFQYDSLPWGTTTIYRDLVEQQWDLVKQQWGITTIYRSVHDSSREWMPLVWAAHIYNVSEQFFKAPPTNTDIYKYVDYRYNDFFEVQGRYEGFIEGHVMEELWEETIGEKPERGFEGMSDDPVRRE